jgi:hypothetical protein
LKSESDPKNDRISLGATVQFTLTSKWAVAVSPSYRRTSLHSFIQRFVGVDNPNTFIDERAFFRINEDTTARFLDIPILLRRYTKEHTEPGGRWFYEIGPVYRKISNVRTSREIDPEPGEPVRDTIPLVHKESAFGGVLGIGGQLIDDFGIRATPEFRYTYWASKPFDAINGRSRVHQFEILVTFGF